MSAAGGKPTAYRGPFPFREGVSCADFDKNGKRTLSNFAVIAGDRVTIYHNGFDWFLRFESGFEANTINRLRLPSDLACKMRLAFGKALQGVGSQYPIIMVDGIAFQQAEVVGMRELLRCVP